MPLAGTAIVESDAGYAQTVRAGRHSLSADEPTERGGTDTGPAPYELVLAGLGACTAITLRMYAARKGWELGHVRVLTRMFKDDSGDRIEREIRIDAPLDDDKRAKLLEIADKTPVTKTMRAGASITTTIKHGE
jgi:putative redox protein